MKSIKNKTFRIQQRNQHLKNVLEDSYYIELGTIDISVMEKLMNGELVNLKDIYHPLLLEEGVGRITEESKNEVKYQFNVLKSLRSKTTSNKIFLTCGLLHYHLKDDNEYYAPIVLIPVDIDFTEETIIVSSRPIVNNMLTNEIQAHLGIDVSYNETFRSLYDIDKYCIDLAKTTECTFSVGNYLTVISVEYTENTLNFEDFSTERSIYETPSKVILQKYFETIKPVVPTNIYQKRALLKIASGESFVIDGKTASGKKQTILNAISNAVLQNKKILYVSQDSDSIRNIEKLMRQYHMANYCYNLCKNYPTNEEEGNIIPNIREEKIGIDTIMPLSLYEEALYSKINGCNYSKIISTLALIKNKMPEIQKIPIEVSLQSHEIQGIYQELKDIERILYEIEPLDINVWSGVEQYYNKSHVNEIISSTKKYANLLKQFNKDMNAYTKKYGIKLPSNFINAQKLLTYISTFEKLMPPSCWVEQYNPAKINELLERISSFQKENRKLNEVYDEYVTSEYKKNKIDELVEVLCYKHLTIENEYEINNILQDEKIIRNAIDTIKKEQKVNTKSLLNLSQIVNNNEFDNEFFIYLNNLIDLVKSVHVKKTWVDFYLRNSFGIVEHYKRLLDTINQYLQIKEKLQSYLMKDSSLSYAQIKELSNNKEFIKLTIRMFNKRLLRQNHITTDECCKMVIDLIELGDKLLDEVTSTNVIDKENLDVFINKYKVWINFIINLNKKQIKLFNNHLVKNSSSIVDTNQLLNVYNEFNTSKTNLEDTYIALSKYGIELEKDLITEKNLEIVEWIDYLKRVLETIETLKLFYKKSNIKLDDLIVIMNNDREYANLENLLNQNQRQMITYLGTTYKGLDTDCLLISILEKHYGYFLNSLNSKEHIQELVEKDLVKTLVEENKEMLKLSESVQIEHNLFSRYFIGGKASILECNLQDAVKKIHKYEERIKEIKPIFQIFEYVKRFDKLGLKHLSEGILESKYSKGISDIYIYSTYYDYQYELMNKNPILSDSNNFQSWLDNYNYFENNHCIATIRSLEKNKVEVDKRIINKVKKIPFNHYDKIITELINHKKVFLIDLNMFNDDIDFSKFDLVFVDDVNLSTSFKYNPIMDCKQVILLGDSSHTINNSNSIFSQIPKRKILRYPMSYIKYNQQFGNVPTINNEYILDYKKNLVTTKFDDLESLVKEIVLNFYKDTNKLINIYVHKNNYKVACMRELIIKLKEYFSDEDIFELLENNIKIITVPNESTRVCDEAYILYNDFIDIDTEIFKKIVTNFSTVKQMLYIYVTAENEMGIEDLEKHISNVLKYNTKVEKVLPDLVQLIYNELDERGVKVEAGHGRLDLIIKGKMARNKVITPNVGIIIEGLDSRIPYSTLNDYQYYYEEYERNGWKIFILFVDDLIDNLQSHLDKICKFLSKDDQRLTHQLKIDEFIG